jgi:hypothetical protein
MSFGVARFLSTLLHPVFVNLLSLVVLVSLYPAFRHSLSGHVLFTIIAFIFATTGLLPAAIVGLMKLYGSLTSVMMHKKEDRILPFVITAGMYAFNYWICRRVLGSGPLAGYLLACASVSVIILIVNFFDKVSIHLASLGALCGVILSAVQVADIDIRWILALAVVLAGVAASARLFMHAHRPLQLLNGFMLGFAVTCLLLP